MTGNGYGFDEDFFWLKEQFDVFIVVKREREKEIDR